MSKTNFTQADLEQWTEQGLLTPAQLLQIRTHLESVGSVTEQAQAGSEQRKGLNFISIAYYFGGFMILLAYTFFMGLQWESLGLSGQITVSALTILCLGAIGLFLRRQKFLVAGGLLVFVATGIVPLFMFSLQRALGWWPDDYRYNYEDFYTIVARTWVLLELVSIAVAVLVIWRVRFSLITLLIAFWTWFLSMDITRWLSHSDYWTWSDREQIVSLVIGLGMLALGLLLQRKARQDYSFWFYLFGHLIILTHFSALALNHEGPLGLLFITVYLAFVIASVWLQRRVFLVFGALGCYGYCSYLAFQVFDGALGFVFALGSIGLLMVLTAVGYQKYVRGWLENRLKRYQISAVQS